MDKDTGHYTNIFIRDLPSATTVNEFKEMFRKYGPIHDCKLLYHPRTRKFEGDALVLYENSYSAHDAIADMNDRVLDGRKVRVQFADRQPEKPKDVKPVDRISPRREESYDRNIRERSRSPPNISKRRQIRALDKTEPNKMEQSTQPTEGPNQQLQQQLLSLLFGNTNARTQDSTQDSYDPYAYQTRPQ